MNQPKSITKNILLIILFLFMALPVYGLFVDMSAKLKDGGVGSIIFVVSILMLFSAVIVRVFKSKKDGVPMIETVIWGGITIVGAILFAIFGVALLMTIIMMLGST